MSKYNLDMILASVVAPTGVYENVSINQALTELDCTEAAIDQAISDMNPPEPSDKKRIRLRNELDLVAGEVRKSVASPGEMVDQEYLLAYTQAVEWKSSGYTGEAPLSVKYWSSSSQFTDQEAADDIIATRDKFNYILLEVRRIRLDGKFQLDNCQPQDIDSVFNQYSSDLKSLLN